MSTQLLLEEKKVLLKNELCEKLRKKHALELEIDRQFEELKKLEISLEKRSGGKAGIREPVGIDR